MELSHITGAPIYQKHMALMMQRLFANKPTSLNSVTIDVYKYEITSLFYTPHPLIVPVSSIQSSLKGSIAWNVSDTGAEKKARREK